MPDEPDRSQVIRNLAALERSEERSARDLPPVNPDRAWLFQQLGEP